MNIYTINTVVHAQYYNYTSAKNDSQEVKSHAVEKKRKVNGRKLLPPNKLLGRALCAPR